MGEGLKRPIRLRELRDLIGNGNAEHFLDGLGAYDIARLEYDDEPKLGANLDAQDHNVSHVKTIQFSDFTLKEIISGHITVDRTCHAIDTENEASEDDLVTINGGAGGKLLFIHPYAMARKIIIKHGTGNIYLQGERDIELLGITNGMFFMFVSTVPPAGIWVDVTKMPPPQGWELVESKILTGDVASVSFSNLSSEYNAFRLTAFIRRWDAGSPLATGVRFNDDDGSNYDYVDIQGNGSTATSTSAAGQTYALAGQFDDSHYGIAFIYIQNRLAATEKEMLSFAGFGGDTIRNISNRWNNTSDLIDKITILAVIGNLLTGSQFILEGCRA